MSNEDALLSEDQEMEEAEYIQVIHTPKYHTALLPMSRR